MSPAWLEPLEAVPSWPVVTTDALGCRIGVPAPWAEAGPEAWTEAAVTHQRWRGAPELDGLHVARMEGADPGVERWIQALVAVSGGPCPELWGARDVPPEPLAWAREAAPGLAERLAVDEVAAFSGRARGDRSYLAIYVVLTRRGEVAWRVTLVLESACPPGSPLIASNDDLRASACLGALDYCS